MIVANQPFVIPEHEKEESEISPISTLQGLALGRLDEFPVLYNALVGNTVKFALLGVRDFRTFSGVGFGPYDGCAVIAFADPLGDRLRSATSGLANEVWLGNMVFFLSKVREGSLRTRPEQLNLLVTQLGPHILVTAADRDSMHSLLERRAGLQTGRALHDRLPEWADVDMRSAVWAMRHYKHTYDPQTNSKSYRLVPGRNLMILTQLVSSTMHNLLARPRNFITFRTTNK